VSVRTPWSRRALRSTRWPLLAYVPPAILVVRRRRAWRLPQPLSLVLAWSVPLAVAAALPRGRARAVAAWSAHMWAYKIAFEVPYDRPERLRRRLHIDAPIMADSVLGLGEPPGERMQRRLRHPPQLNAIDRTLTFVYALWEAEPHAGLAWILARHPERFPEAALRLGATFDMTLLGYVLLPAAPPWWASEREGRMGRAVRRVTAEVGKELKRDPRPGIDHNAGANPWAAMPSDHFATAVSTATLLWEADRRMGAAAAAYAALLGVALVHTGEHYVTDLLAGAALAVGVNVVGRQAAGPATRLAERIAAPAPPRRRMLGR
jgi:membrane-associated phospholipid phosphatase